ncbi:collagen-binding domain-containing protein [Asanoa siamensis]|uniref:Choice-of-anchor A domain-containing protein n=1 Tax=Asanoa siamensis TaxID=926357 RepID=A0ABQ4CW56_9ACTN|nr:collagen-binding domain-containing protein [Asanoa siamensis]GIF75512.1 hypothetical protein Asi02nite_50300 [Asanoa siamensis]
MAATAVGAVAAGASLWMLTPAAATGPVNPVEGGLGFLVLVEGDATLTATESEGPLAVGGDLTFGSAYRIASERNVRVGAGDSPLVIGGRALIGAPPVVDAKVLDADGVIRAEDPPRALPGNKRKASLAAQDAIDFAGVFATFRERSERFGTCTETVTLRNSGGGELARPISTPDTKAYVSLTPNQTNVLNLTGAEFNNLSDLTFNTQPSAATPLLVNVDTAAAYEWRTANFAGISDNQAPFILMNFPNATSLTQVGADTAEGTIYAPKAAFTDVNTANNEGNLVVRRYTHGSAATNGGETHDLAFNTTLRCGAADPMPAASGPARTLPAAAASTVVTPASAPASRPAAARPTASPAGEEPEPLDSKFPWTWPSEPHYLPGAPSASAPVAAEPSRPAGGTTSGQPGSAPAQPGDTAAQPGDAGQPAGGEPAGGEPAGGNPAGGNPSGGDPSGGDPAAGDPAGGDPAAGEQPAAGDDPAVGGEPAGDGGDLPFFPSADPSISASAAASTSASPAATPSGSTEPAVVANYGPLPGQGAAEGGEALNRPSNVRLLIAGLSILVVSTALLLLGRRRKRRHAL